MDNEARLPKWHGFSRAVPYPQNAALAAEVSLDTASALFLSLSKNAVNRSSHHVASARPSRSHPVPKLRAAIVSLIVLLAGCSAPRNPAPDWTAMDKLVGSWGCEASFQTPQGPLTVPMVTEVRHGMSNRWLQIHREAPGWDRSTGRFVEDEYTGWDRRRARWVTTVSNNFGVTGYLTSTGWQGTSMQWDLHPFTDLSLPLRNRTTWSQPSANEWIAENHTPANPGVTILLSERCLKREPLSF